MLHIRTLVLGSYQTNCYIVSDEEGRCAVIDPGYEAEKILAVLRENGLTLEAILLTHGHFDHVGAVEALVKATSCALWMREGDYSQFPTPVNRYFYPLANADFTEISFCEEGEVIPVGSLRFTVMETPGHTWGSVCYFCEDALFSGDTLFEGSCGRIDLPGGDRKAMLASLERLSELEGNWRVFPGHGSATTLAEEKRYNPYLKGML